MKDLGNDKLTGLGREYVESKAAYNQTLHHGMPVAFVQSGQDLGRPKKVLTWSAIDAVDKARQQEEEGQVG